MDDSKIIDLFFSRCEEAIACISENYGRLLKQTANNILCNERDSEECVNDAYLGIWNSIPPQRPASLKAFAVKIVRNISINKLKYNTANKRSGKYDVCLEELEDCLPCTDRQFEQRRLSEAMRSFVDALEYTNRLIFVRRYFYLDSCEEIADKTGLSNASVHTRLSRLRKELKIMLEKEEIFIRYADYSLTDEDFNCLPDIASFIEELDLSKLSPEHTETDGKEFRYSSAMGWYEKTKSGVVSVVKVTWKYLDSIDYPPLVYIDETFFILTTNGAKQVTREDIISIIGENRNIYKGEYGKGVEVPLV